MEKVIASLTPKVAEEEKDEGVELCDCKFSLAYGNKVLLRKTRLRLVKGQNYDLIGKNDSGKTFFMKAIADHRVEGFSDKSELRTVFVETDIQGELSDLSVLYYIIANKLLACLNTRFFKMEPACSLGSKGRRPSTMSSITRMCTCLGYSPVHKKTQILLSDRTLCYVYEPQEDLEQ